MKPKKTFLKPPYTATEKQLDDMLFVLDAIDKEAYDLSCLVDKLFVAVNELKRIRAEIRSGSKR